MAKKSAPAPEAAETQDSVSDVILKKYPVLANPSTVVFESKGGQVSSCSAAFFKANMSRPMTTGKQGTPKSDDRYNNITVLYISDADGNICDPKGNKI